WSRGNANALPRLTSFTALPRLGMRCVGELAELRGEQVRDLLTDVDRVIADSLQGAGHQHHPQPVLAHPRRLSELEDAPDHATIRAVDELVELDERLGALEVAIAERVERDSDHFLAA